jgi:hypothetical protein
MKLACENQCKDLLSALQFLTPATLRNSLSTISEAGKSEAFCGGQGLVGSTAGEALLGLFTRFSIFRGRRSHEQIIAKQNEGRHRFRQRPFGSVTPGSISFGALEHQSSRVLGVIEEHAGGA